MRRCRSRLPRDVEQSREGKIDSGFTPLSPEIHVGGVERVDRSRARARRGSARRIRRGPLAPGITGRPAGVRSASAGANVRRGARSTAKFERSRARVDFHGAFTGFRPGSCATPRQYLARSLSPKARARLGRCGDSRRGSRGRTVRRLANARLRINLKDAAGGGLDPGDRLQTGFEAINTNHEPRVRANILKTSIFQTVRSKSSVVRGRFLDCSA